MKIILSLLLFTIITISAYSGGNNTPGKDKMSGEIPGDFEVTYYMKDTITGSNLIMEIKKEKLEVDYINGKRKISKRKFYELEEEEIEKLYKYIVDEKIIEMESPEKTITQNTASQYIAVTYNKRENVLIFSAAGDPPLPILKLKYKLWDLVSRYDKFWQRDMHDVIKIDGYEEK